MKNNSVSKTEDQDKENEGHESVNYAVQYNLHKLIAQIIIKRQRYSRLTNIGDFGFRGCLFVSLFFLHLSDLLHIL